MVRWAIWQNDNFAGYQNALPELTEAEVLAKFEKRTGLLATYAALEVD